MTPRYGGRTGRLLIEGATVLSYGQLDRRAEDLARALVARGAAGDMTIGVGAPRSAEHVIAALAVWKAGGVYVPLATDLPPARIADMLGIAGVRLTVGPGLTISEVADPPVDQPLAGLPLLPGERGRRCRLRLLHLGLDRPSQGGGPHARGHRERGAVVP